MRNIYEYMILYYLIPERKYATLKTNYKKSAFTNQNRLRYTLFANILPILMLGLQPLVRFAPHRLRGFRPIGQETEEGDCKLAFNRLLLSLGLPGSMPKHILHKYPISPGGVLDKHMGHRPQIGRAHV